MQPLCALLASPALSIALAVGVLWVATGGVCPTALRPRGDWMLANGAAVGVAVFVAVRAFMPASGA